MARQTWQSLLDLASRLEPRLARAYIEAINRLRAKVNATAIARAIAEQRPHFIPSATLPLLEQAMDPAIGIVTDAIRQSGQMTADRLKDGLGVGMRFDLTNPLAVEVARQTAAGMVTNISAETRLALQNVIRRAIEDGITYRDSAALIRQMVGLTARDSQAVLNLRASLVELGLSREKVLAQVQRYAAKKLRERSLTIARTELINSMTGGQVAAWRQATEKGLLPQDAMMRWMTTPDDRLCERCLAMDGKTVSIWGSFPGGNPARHPRCRCVLVLAIAAVAARRRVA